MNDAFAFDKGTFNIARHLDFLMGSARQYKERILAAT